MITKLKFKNFTGFKELEINFSPGINVFVGENGTGKTHILKVVYTAVAALNEKKRISDKIVDVFLPKDKNIGRLVRRVRGSSSASVSIWKKGSGDEREKLLRLIFSNHTKDTLRWVNGWQDETIGKAVYIPVKEMLANAPNFLALYEKFQLHFEAVYADIIHYANLPTLKGPIDEKRKKLLEIIQENIDGKVLQKKEMFYLKNRKGELEFTLLAEGMRKLGLLWLLINNGTLLNGSILCWDEPETNLNPKLMRTVVSVLLELQRMGVQLFISTHDYVILKEIDLQMNKTDMVSYHSLYKQKNDDDSIAVHTVKNYLEIHPNSISDTFSDLYDRDLTKGMGGLGK